ncbi:MAG: hypothetical protein KatS3mg028_1703 [Bacteroidia bacterium]|nr:MAG: hypothetical protein KatS3mg028_1703 [Bacteroidia bacterium]
MKTIYPFLFLYLTSLFVSAQQILWENEVIYAIPFIQKDQKTIKRQLGYDLSYQSRIAFSVNEIIEINGGFEQHLFHNRVKDLSFGETYNGFRNLSKIDINYYGLQAGLKIYLPFSNGLLQHFIQANYHTTFLPNGTMIDSAFFPLGNESVKLTTNVPGKFDFIDLSAGIQGILTYNLSWTFRIGTSIPIDNQWITTSLERINNNSFSQSKSQIKFTGYGVSLGLGLRYKIMKFHYPRIRISPPDHKPKDKSPQIANVVDTSAKILHQRPYDIRNTWVVNDSIVKLAIWDDKREDGDELSIYLNEQTILDHYILVKAPMVVYAYLKPGNNDLILYAHNLGEIPPNTAVIRLEAPGFQHKVLMKSNTERSMAIRLIYKPK